MYRRALITVSEYSYARFRRGSGTKGAGGGWAEEGKSSYGSRKRGLSTANSYKACRFDRVHPFMFTNFYFFAEEKEEQIPLVAIRSPFPVTAIILLAVACTPLAALAPRARHSYL